MARRGACNTTRLAGGGRLPARKRERLRCRGASARGLTCRAVVQMARDALPCDTDAKFRMACASVSHHASATGGRKFKVASKGTKLFDEAYR